MKDISKRMKLEPTKIKTDILSEDIESAIQSIDPEIRDSIQMAVKTFMMMHRLKILIMMI